VVTFCPFLVGRFLHQRMVLPSLVADVDRNMLLKGKWKGKNKNSCIIDGTVLLCIKVSKYSSFQMAFMNYTINVNQTEFRWQKIFLTLQGPLFLMVIFLYYTKKTKLLEFHGNLPIRT
jgi:hypothetical protein